MEITYLSLWSPLAALLLIYSGNISPSISTTQEAARVSKDQNQIYYWLTISVVNFVRNGQLGWIVWGGLTLDYVLRIAQLPPWMPSFFWEIMIIDELFDLS
jgi:hypothetical protein